MFMKFNQTTSIHKDTDTFEIFEMSEKTLEVLVTTRVIFHLMY